MERKEEEKKEEGEDNGEVRNVVLEKKIIISG